MAGYLITSLLSLGTTLLPTIRASAQAPSSSSNCNNSEKERIAQEDLERLMRTLKRIKATLYDAEEREIRDRSVKLWLNELKKVAYDAEDVLSEYRYEVTRLQVEARKTTQASSSQGKEDEGFLIPKGWKVIPLLQNIHHNPDFFHDPEKFDPSRFEVPPKSNTFRPSAPSPHNQIQMVYARS